MFVKKFYTSDTHFGHERLLTMQPRPFLSIEEHDEHLIERWNAVVGENDIVYHLGDFAFRLLADADRVRNIFARLRGRKHLIIGNHDVGKNGALHPTLGALDWASRPEHALRTTDGGRDVWLSHYAGRVWPSSHHGSVHFYGHSHGRLAGCGLSRDVGVDLPDVDSHPGRSRNSGPKNGDEGMLPASGSTYRERVPKIGVSLLQCHPPIETQLR